MILFIVILSVGTSQAAIGCVGVYNKPVDWFIAYKMPRIKNGPSSYFKSGVGLMYMDDRNPTWSTLNHSVNDDQQPISYTLEQIYEITRNNESGDKTHLMYNDQPPYGKSSSSSKGHAKGDICFDKTSGFWLVHSVPSFPSQSDKERYPESGTVYGQIFMCVTFPTDQLDLIGIQLQYVNPILYSQSISPYFETASPNFWGFLVNGTRIIKNKKVKSYDSVVTLKSLGMKKFVSFAKSKHFGKDLYLDLVAPKLKNSLLVQSWLKGEGDLPSNCSFTYSVKNLLGLNMMGLEFKSLQDHSKWAISDQRKETVSLEITPSKEKGKTPKPTKKRNVRKRADSTKWTKWICVADINRQSSQTSRGGGALCFEDGKVWKNFKDVVVAADECNV